MLEPSYQGIIYFENDPKKRLTGRKLEAVLNLLHTAFEGSRTREEIMLWIKGSKTGTKDFPYPITNCEVLIIEDVANSKIAGAIITADYRDVRYIPLLATNPEYQRRGIAKVMVEAIKGLQREGVEIRVHHRGHLKKFYKSLGFNVENTGIKYSRGKPESIHRARWIKPK